MSHFDCILGPIAKPYVPQDYSKNCSSCCQVVPNYLLKKYLAFQQSDQAKADHKAARFATIGGFDAFAHAINITQEETKNFTQERINTLKTASINPTLLPSRTASITRPYSQSI